MAQLQYLATVAHSHVRRVEARGGDAPSALELPVAPPPCAQALIVGGASVELQDNQRRHDALRRSNEPEQPGRELARYLQRLGFCPRMIASGEKPPSVAPEVHKAALIIRLRESRYGWMLGAVRRGTVLVDLVTPGALHEQAHEGHPHRHKASPGLGYANVDGDAAMEGVLPLHSFCSTQRLDRCVISVPQFEVLLRLAMAALHPFDDMASKLMGSLEDVRLAGGASSSTRTAERCACG